MSKHTALTIEEVDNQLAAIEAKQATQKAQLSPAQHPDKVSLLNICAIITLAVPILTFIKFMLFWKPKWQAIIQQVIDAAGVACSVLP